MKEVLLSICIPTYNRAAKVRGLLSFLKEELDSSDITCDICVLVRNNCSTDNTEDVVLNSDLFSDDKYNTLYIKNPENIGLLGNLEKLYKEAPGKYMWILGDDDKYHHGIVKAVYEEVKKEQYSFIFINHSCFYYNDDGTKKGLESVIGDVDVSDTSKNVLANIFIYSGTSMMFISACVHRTENTRRAFELYGMNLSYPLFQSFYSASSGETKVISDTLIDDIVNGISWGDKMDQVFYKECPEIISLLPKLGYDQSVVKKMLYSYRKRLGLLWYQRLMKKVVIPFYAIKKLYAF